MAGHTATDGRTSVNMSTAQPNADGTGCTGFRLAAWCSWGTNRRPRAFAGSFSARR